MILGLRRGLAAAACLMLGMTANAQMFEKNHVIPETVDAIDLNTGTPYYAPPVPGGHYTKDTLGHIAGTIHGAAAHAKGALNALCSKCGGAGTCAGCGSGSGTGAVGICDSCGGKGRVAGSGHDHAHGQGHSHNSGGAVHHMAANGSGGHRHFAGQGVVAAPSPIANGHFGGHAKATPQIGPSGQNSPYAGTYATACGAGGCGGKVCGEPTCFGGFGGKGNGHGGLFAGHGGKGGFGGCGNAGCNSCGNGGIGNGMGHGMGGHPAGPCGTPGCGTCASLMGAHKGLLAKAAGLFGKHHGPKWFMGPGGPVPLTPGYVHWVNPIRSPRDYFAFPPYLDQAMSPGYGSLPQSTAGFATDRATTPTDYVAPTPAPSRTAAPVPPPPPRSGGSISDIPPASRTLRERTAPPAPAPGNENQEN